MNFYEYQAGKAKVDKHGEAPVADIPEIKVEQLEAREAPIEVEVSDVSDTFLGRLDARIRKLWGKE